MCVVQGCRDSKVILVYCRFSRVVQVCEVTEVVRSDPRLVLPN